MMQSCQNLLQKAYVIYCKSQVFTSWATTFDFIHILCKILENTAKKTNLYLLKLLLRFPVETLPGWYSKSWELGFKVKHWQHFPNTCS